MAGVFDALLILIAVQRPGVAWLCAGLAVAGSTVGNTVLFWAAFILTRPLGAVVGDFLDKPLSSGGLALSRYTASAALFAFMLACILFFEQKAAKVAH